MPIYEYRCGDCGHEFEKLVKLGASPPPCPTCEGSDVTKRVSAGSFVLRGSGWYKDHYGLKSGGSSSSSGGSSSGGSSSGGSSAGGSSSGGSSGGGEASL